MRSQTTPRRRSALAAAFAVRALCALAVAVPVASAPAAACAPAAAAAPAMASAPAAAPAPVAASVPSADGLSIHYDVQGSGDTALVLIHGWSCDASYWAGQVAAFADRYRVVTLDLAGHGGSGVGPRDWSIAAYAQDVRAVVERLDLKRAVLIGHSMGGYVAVAAAGLLPDRVVAVIGVDTLQDAERTITPEMLAPLMAGMKADFPGFTANFVRQMFPADADSALVARIAADMGAAPPEVAVPSFAGLFAYDLKSGLASLACPVRCLNSDRHPTNVEGNRKYARDFDVVLLKGRGHFPHLERPAEFNAALAALLQGVAP